MQANVGGSGDGARVLFRGLHIELGRAFSNADFHVDIFAPYITPRAFLSLVADTPKSASITVTTTWKLRDLVLGASSVELFDACEQESAALFLCPRLHLKTYTVDYRRIFTGSANLTGRGLGTSADANHETLIDLPDGGPEYLGHLATLKAGSTLVTAQIHGAFKEALRNAPEVSKDELEEEQAQLTLLLEESNAFLISQLPMSRNPEILYSAHLGCDDEKSDADTVAQSIHDIALYGLPSPSTLEWESFRSLLIKRFFSHPFIIALCQFIDRPRKFGEIKQWVQENCTNVPVPSRRDLTGNVQVLYAWLKDLGSDRFEVWRPRHTELIGPRNN